MVKTSNAKILSVACITPPYHTPVQDVIPYAQSWVSDKDTAFQSKVKKIFEKSEVNSRHTVLPLPQVFSQTTLDESNGLYKDKIVDYAELAFKQAILDAELNAADIDCLIAISCTGHMSPSLDAILINRLGMKASIQRLPVMEMGCIGGVAGLIYAETYLKAYPDRYVALICAELSSLTFQRDDFSWANIVSAAIFGDGIACAILGPSEQAKPRIKASRMHHFPDTADLLGFNLSSTGFRMVLDETLPEKIRQAFPDFTTALLAPLNLELENIQHFIVHPGGKKILKNLELILKRHGKNLDDSRAVLGEFGNVSSETVLFILKRFLDKAINPGEMALMLAFGPGLTAGSVLLEWD